jgi:cytidylate kinase
MTETMNLIIAVDGPAASGKGTVAGALARHYGLPYLDTGLLYRAVGVQAQAAGGLDEATAAAVAQDLNAVLLDHPKARTRAAGGEQGWVGI